ncbi:hypothetical protein ACHAXR_001510, partial [Thalassiosira sp. AJA248-18]
MMFAVFALLIVEVHLQTVVAQNAPEEEVEDDEPTCSLDSSTKSDCATAEASASIETPATNYHDGIISNRQDLTRQVVSLTDETFDELTLTSTPATWLIMFKTDSCGLCKKATPVFEALSIDADIVNHNDRELETIYDVQTEKQQPVEERMTEEKEGTPKGPVYVWEGPTEEGEFPKGPVYIATIDAGSWSGRDTTKRFGIDATPTIFVLRNEGHGNKSKIDSRSYYVYRGQRAIFPLRYFVLGGFSARKRMNLPSPLSQEERKPQSYWGRVYDIFISPSAKWAGGIIGKILLAWFSFIAVLGLGMRVHNYAWGDNADDDLREEREREIEKEKAQGRKDYDPASADERSVRQQKVMWEKKAKNRAKFAANKEAREKKKGSEDE